MVPARQNRGSVELFSGTTSETLWDERQLLALPAEDCIVSRMRKEQHVFTVGRHTIFMKMVVGVTNSLIPEAVSSIFCRCKHS